MSDAISRLNEALAGRYRIERVLGEGGMATVYLAEDPRHRREVALKVLHPELSGALGAERFLREIETVAGLTHPHILALHDSGETADALYYAMPYVSEGTLRARLDAEGALPVEEAVRIAAECAEALEHAHERGVIHRDLKPANVLFSGGHAVVADFGIATAVKEAAEGAALTRTGISLGTTGYMSPEQAAGEESVDGRSDVYALGCLLYEMLTGERAFSGRTAQAILARQLSGDVPSVTLLRPSAPAALASAVERALALSPADRFGSAAEMRRFLQSAMDMPQTDRSHTSDGPHTRRGRTVIPAALVAVTGVALAGWVAWTNWAESEAPPRGPLTPMPLTSFRDLEDEPALSSDGSQVAFVSAPDEPDAKSDLYVMLAESGAEPLRLTETNEWEYDPAWSPDGTRIAFLRWYEDDTVELRTITPFGGEDRLISTVDRPWRGTDWSPDGTLIAVSARNGLQLIDPATSRVTRLTDPPPTHYDEQPAFSPDGQSVAFMRLERGTGIGVVYTKPVEGDHPPEPATQRYLLGDGVGDVDWSRTGRRLLITEGVHGYQYLLEVDLDDPVVDTLLVEAGFRAISVAHSTGAAAFARRTVDHNVWRFPGPMAEPGDRAERWADLTREDSYATASPDGQRVAYNSNRGGLREIWVANTDGTNPRPLTELQYSMHPEWSPSGDELAFYIPDNVSEVPRGTYLIDPDGGAARLLFADGVTPSWSRDGRSIYVQYKGEADNWRVWRVPSGGGQPEQLTWELSFSPREGPGGRIYFQRPTRQILSIRPGETDSEVVVEGNIAWGDYWIWRDQLLFADWGEAPGNPAIWALDLGSDEPTRTKLVPLDGLRRHTAGWNGFSVSPDGRWIYYTLLDEWGLDLLHIDDLR